MKNNKTSLSNIDIVIYAVYKLGGWQKRVHSENIALKCFELAPRKFSWVKFPQYPDILPSLFALEAAKKKKYGKLVIGETERRKTFDKIGGWVLTVNGVRWIKNNLARIEQGLELGEAVGKRLPIDRKLKHLDRSKAFQKFKLDNDTTEISYAEFVESLICTVNTRPGKIKDRLNQLSAIAEELNKKDVKNYIKFCKKKFRSLTQNKVGDFDDG